MIDKAVILARGLGTRMRRTDEAAAVDEAQARVADLGLKAMIPVGRPFLDYVLSALADAGYHRVCLVIGPEHDLVREYYASQAGGRVEVSFAIQEEPRGTADAVTAAEAFAGEDPFLMINSDNYYPTAAFRALRDLEGSGLVGFDRRALVARSNIEAERVLKFAVVQVGEDGVLERIVEKPTPEQMAALPEPLLVSMNCWRFGPKIFEACRSISLSPRGELELSDAVQWAVDRLGERFTVVPMAAAVLDLTARSDIASIKAALADVTVRL